jgi:hypothetical protein
MGSDANRMVAGGLNPVGQRTHMARIGGFVGAKRLFMEQPAISRQKPLTAFEARLAGVHSTRL